MTLLQGYLLVGLVTRKIIWEALRRRSVRPKDERRPFAVVVLKLCKGILLAAIVAQTFVPDLFPIADRPAALRAIGAILFTLGWAITVTARVQLGRNWSDLEEGGVYETQALQDAGLYRFVRHPIYGGDLLLLLGFELALNSRLVLGVVVLAPFVFSAASREERQLESALPGYAEYRQRTKRFIPFVL